MKSYNEFLFERLEYISKNEPDKIAITEKDRTMTYKEFNSKVKTCAAALIKLGISKGDVVGVLMNRSSNMIVLAFAILRAGAVYLPISLSNPTERTRFIIKDSGAKLVIFDKERIDMTSSSFLCFDEIVLQPVAKITFPEVYEYDLAYAMYTSGTSGNPKGVLIEYKSMYNRLIWQLEEFPINTKDIVLQKTINTFDVSIWEIFLWSMAGAGLCLLQANKEHIPREVIKNIRCSGVNVVHFVPSVFHVFLNYIKSHPKDNCLNLLKYCFLSGEQANRQDVALFFELCTTCRLINLYGPTEATIDVTFFDCSEFEKYDRIPIGRPVSNTEILLVDDKNQVISDFGVKGELCISGVQLARSYINQSILDKEKFLILSNGKRVYKTGDLAVKLPNGIFEYHGRIDRQIKLNGIRIELMEIENAILKLDYISNAAVVLSEERKIIAYYASTTAVCESKLRKDLMQILPRYMIPIACIRCLEFPLKENGKINYAMLPKSNA